jgi:GABA permease
MQDAGLYLDATVVGDPDPVAAVGDALRAREFDEVIVSTLPRGVSRWLRLSLPHRLERMTDLPVHHVIAHPRPPRLSPLPQPQELVGTRS